MSNPYTPPQGYHLEPDVATTTGTVIVPPSVVQGEPSVTHSVYGGTPQPTNVTTWPSQRVADVPAPVPTPVPNVMWMLTHSRKALIVTVDTLSALIGLIATRYLSPQDVDFVLKVVLLLQAPILMWIYTITVEDKARLDAGLSA